MRNVPKSEAEYYLDCGDLGQRLCRIEYIVEEGEPTVLAADPNDSYQGHGPTVEYLDVILTDLDNGVELNVTDMLTESAIESIEEYVVDLDFGD